MMVDEYYDEEVVLEDEESLGDEDLLASIKSSLQDVYRERKAAEATKATMEESEVSIEVVEEESVASNESEYEEQVIEKWFERDVTPDDLLTACTALIPIVYKGEDVDAEAMLRRTPLPELYKYLKQHYDYKKDVKKEVLQEETFEPVSQQTSLQALFQARSDKNKSVSLRGQQLLHESIASIASEYEEVIESEHEEGSVIEEVVVEEEDRPMAAWQLRELAKLKGPIEISGTTLARDSIETQYTIESDHEDDSVIEEIVVDEEDILQPDSHEGDYEQLMSSIQSSLQEEFRQRQANAKAQVADDEVSEGSEYEEQVIEKWFGRDVQPDDLHAACTELIPLVYKGEDVDPIAMMRRSPLPELYKYLKQHYDYLKDVKKEDLDNDPAPTPSQPTLAAVLQGRQQGDSNVQGAKKEEGWATRPKAAWELRENFKNKEPGEKNDAFRHLKTKFDQPKGEKEDETVPVKEPKVSSIVEARGRGSSYPKQRFGDAKDTEKEESTHGAAPAGLPSYLNRPSGYPKDVKKEDPEEKTSPAQQHMVQSVVEGRGLSASYLKKRFGDSNHSKKEETNNGFPASGLPSYLKRQPGDPKDVEKEDPEEKTSPAQQHMVQSVVEGRGLSASYLKKRFGDSNHSKKEETNDGFPASGRPSYLKRQPGTPKDVEKEDPEEKTSPPQQPMVPSVVEGRGLSASFLKKRFGDSNHSKKEETNDGFPASGRPSYLKRQPGDPKDVKKEDAEEKTSPAPQPMVPSVVEGRGLSASYLKKRFGDSNHSKKEETNNGFPAAGRPSYLKRQSGDPKDVKKEEPEKKSSPAQQPTVPSMVYGRGNSANFLKKRFGDTNHSKKEEPNNVAAPVGLPSYLKRQSGDQKDVKEEEPEKKSSPAQQPTVPSMVYGRGNSATYLKHRFGDSNHSKKEETNNGAAPAGLPSYLKRRPGVPKDVEKEDPETIAPPVQQPKVSSISEGRGLSASYLKKRFGDSNHAKEKSNDGIPASGVPSYLKRRSDHAKKEEPSPPKASPIAESRAKGASQLKQPLRDGKDKKQAETDDRVGPQQPPAVLAAKQGRRVSAVQARIAALNVGRKSANGDVVQNEAQVGVTHDSTDEARHDSSLVLEYEDSETTLEEVTEVESVEIDGQNELGESSGVFEEIVEIEVVESEEVEEVEEYVLEDDEVVEEIEETFHGDEEEFFEDTVIDDDEEEVIIEETIVEEHVIYK